VVAPPRTVFQRNEIAAVKLAVQLRSGYHVNSNTPSEDYLIPLRLTWEPGAFEAAETIYPKPHFEKYSFADKPLSVFTGDFEIVARLKPVKVSAGMGILLGKLRYQACSTTACLPPKTVEVRVPYETR